MKLLANNVNDRINAHLKDALKQITKAAAAPVIRQEESIQQTQPAPTASQGHTYASALINPPAHANPKLAAREGIKARQFLLQSIKESAYGHHDTQKLKAEINRIAKEMGLTEGKVRSVVTQKDDSVLIEVDSDVAAKWFTNILNRVGLCGVLGEHVSFRSRMFNVLAFNVPLTTDPRDIAHLTEINEVNDLEDFSVKAIRWAKPLNRRSPQQKSAHLVLTFNDPEAANHAILNGIMICHKKCHIERIKKEPIQCLKCQGWTTWQEIARKCSTPAEIAMCHTPQAKRCVSCKAEEHR
jgi:hypothetical protein